jgi:hypothetical protein
MDNDIKIVTWINESRYGERITIERYGNHIQIKQGDNIVGSITLDERITENGLKLRPMVIIKIVNGADFDNAKIKNTPK